MEQAMSTIDTGKDSTRMVDFRGRLVELARVEGDGVFEGGVPRREEWV